ncbi:MAG: glutathione S-transferase [Pseudomonadota bacterium]
METTDFPVTATSRLQLFYTPRSHFSRKVRLLFDALRVDFEMVDIGEVGDSDHLAFAGNPAMTVPVLRIDDMEVYDSDHIANVVSSAFDQDDRLRVRTCEIELLNARATMNAIMLADVRIVLAKRRNEADYLSASLDKSRRIISSGLNYLDTRNHLFRPKCPRFHDFHFISMWDHLKLYELMEHSWPELESVADSLHKHSMVARSRPQK